eukprot:TRINITY_DN3954_c0_g1_i1.p1 TRINITY_DN3954_c0_g1~~TRINITY_DN3954_c0_g1_i1.p1  ORF type:complete len:432 (-),score=55.24 TRINITY_DN3954_c0_g1_i1:78-1373(-)
MKGQERGSRSPPISDYEVDTHSPLVESQKNMSTLDHLLFRSGNKQFNTIYLIALVVIIVVIPLILFVCYVEFVSNPFSSSDNTPINNPSPVSHTQYGTNGAVAADDPTCSTIGLSILRDYNGNAMDAAIATALCQGVTNSFASGIGGGGILIAHFNTINSPYNGTNTTFYNPVHQAYEEIIDFREVGPIAAYPFMYYNTGISPSEGAVAVAVPGEIAGLEVAWKRYGSLPWATLFQPAIKLAREGWNVHKLLAERIASYSKEIKADFMLQKTYAPNGVALVEGDHISRPELADTLEAIANKGAQEFYTGEIAQKFIDDLSTFTPKGIMTMQDLSDYYQKGVRISKPISNFWYGYEIMGAHPPFSGGSCISLALNILERYNGLMQYIGKGGKLAEETMWSTQNSGVDAYHYLLEALAFTYAWHQTCPPIVTR